MMRSNGSPFPDDLLKRTSDRDCWVWMYNKPKKPKATKQPPQRTVCFTGFTAARKDELTKLAVSAGWRVIASPGSKKIEKANKQGATVTPESDFLTLL